MAVLERTGAPRAPIADELAQHGVTSHLFDGWREHVEAIRAHGLRLDLCLEHGALREPLPDLVAAALQALQELIDRINTAGGPRRPAR